jgi:hypothetical protein
MDERALPLAEEEVLEGGEREEVVFGEAGVAQRVHGAPGFTGLSRAHRCHMESRRRSPMRKRLIISLDAEIYESLRRAVGPQGISRFIEDLFRPHLMPTDLSAAYAEMALEEAREAEAEIWSDALLRDVAPEAP